MFLSFFALRRKPFALLLFGWLLSLFLPAQIASAQAPTMAWAARYNGPMNGFNAANDLKLDAQGNVYITGQSRGTIKGSDYSTIKYDANGNQLWAARYHGPSGSFDTAYALAVDAQGSVYVTGNSPGSDGAYSAVTIKYDAEGTQLWMARYNGGAGYALALDAQSNVYVTGNGVTIKYDTNGNQLWTAVYQEPTDTYASSNALKLDSQGNVYVTGVTRDSDGAYGEATIKYDADGNQLWVARYSAPGDSSDYAANLAVDAKGSVYVTGYSYGVNAHTDAITIKYDAEGTQLWVARYNGGAGYALALDAQSNVYVTGVAATIKYDSNGNQLWAAPYASGNSSDYAKDLKLDAQGNVYITGGAAGVTVDPVYGRIQECATIKYDANGSQLWATRFSAPNDTYDAAGALALDMQGCVYVTGKSQSGSTGTYLTIKYNALKPIPANITPQVSIMRLGYSYVRSKGRYVQTITVSNTSTNAIVGPVFLALDNLSANAVLFNCAGMTTICAPRNSPYVRATLSDVGNGNKVFDPGEKITFTLEFTNPTNAAISYTPRVLAGAGTP